MFDLLIAKGLVVDGSGTEPFIADVGINDDTISALGPLPNAEARQRIDAEGHMVCPGFIDGHSHGDAFLLLEPSAPSKAFQGVTTDVVGNCGTSIAPITARDHLSSDWIDLDYPGTWQTVAEYRTLLEQVKPLPNVALLAGHNTLRRCAGAYDNRPPTPDEMKTMTRMLDAAMDEGARGISTGLIYPPGRFSNREEIVALAKVAARKNGLYATHMRSEGAKLIEAITEALDIGATANLPIQLSHLKASGKDNWDLIEPALIRIARERDKGQRIQADRYPYVWSHTCLTVGFPDWALEGPLPVRLARLNDPTMRDRLRHDLVTDRNRDWGLIVIGSTFHPDNRRFQGQSLDEAARHLALDPVDAMLYFAETDAMRTSAFFAGMSQDNMQKVLAQSWVMIGSDASIRAPQGPFSQDHPHPRTYGTFTRFLRMALDGQTVPLPEAIRKMTLLPAQTFGFSDRGLVAKGKAADLVVIDPDRVRECTTFANPHALSQGVTDLIVNGVQAIAHGRLTGRRSGRFL